MITILCADDCVTTARSLAEAIQQRYDAAPEPEILTAESSYARESAWDDVLIVVFGSADWPAWGTRFIDDFRAAHPADDARTGQPVPGGMVLPVATGSAAMSPPPPISLLRAVLYDGTMNSLERILRIVGTFLGLALRPGEHQIFISYTTPDGSAIAQDLHARLRNAGFEPWLDTEPGRVPDAEDIRKNIRLGISRAAMLLVVDTPAAPDADWVHDEITQGLSELIPILPIVTGPERDISRFNALVSLQRRVPVKAGGPDGSPISDAEWDAVHRNIEQLLLTAYTRRMEIRAHAEREFKRQGYEWRAVDLRRRMFEASRETNARIAPKVVLSHCSIHDPTYLPALRVYGKYLQEFPNIADINEKLCVLPDTVSGSRAKDIRKGLTDVPQFHLAAYNELALLIRSNFSDL